MSLSDAALAVKGFVATIDKVEAIAASGSANADVDALLTRAKALLDIVDEELADLDGATHREIFRAIQVLRWKLETVRDELTPVPQHGGPATVST